MDTKLFSKVLEEVTYDVEVTLNNEIISSGSAVNINEKITLLTTAHTLVRLDHIFQDASNKEVKIYAKSKQGNYFQCRNVICAPSMRFGELTEPIVIDLAIIQPIMEQTTSKYIPVLDVPPILGEEVLMAGYSDELELPFNFDRILDRNIIDVPRQLQILNLSKRMLMIKAGIVGCINKFELSDEKNKFNWKGSLFYIDNMMHFGASGGPIINSSGELIGIIIKRAITETGNEEILKIPVPSGSCLAISAGSSFILRDYLAQHVAAGDLAKAQRENIELRL